MRFIMSFTKNLNKLLLIGAVLGITENFVTTSSTMEMQIDRTPVLCGSDKLYMNELAPTKIIQDFTQDIRYERIPGANPEIVKTQIEKYVDSIKSTYGISTAIVTASLLKMSFDSFDQSMSGECVLLIGKLAGHILTNIEIADYILKTAYINDTDAISLAADLLYNTGNGSKEAAHKKLREEIVPIMKNLSLGTYIPEGFE